MRFFAALAFSLILFAVAGCRSTPAKPPQPNPLTGEVMPAEQAAQVQTNPINDVGESVNITYCLLTEGLEYVGDKTEDFFEFMGDIYESL